MSDYTSAIRRAAQRHGVSPEVLLAQLRQESGLNPNAKSPAGASGIAQFMPATARSMGVNLHDGKAGDDIDGAARLMSKLLKEFGGSYRKALAAYNAGPGAVQKYGGVPPYAETQAYVKKIMRAAGGAPDSTHGEPSRSSRSPDRTATLSGVSHADERDALKRDYVLGGNRSHESVMALIQGLKGLKDEPGETVNIPGRDVRQSGGGGGKRGAVNLLELFYNGPGGVNVKDGARVPRGFVSGHTDHVHAAAATPKGAIKLGNLAQRMGLTVREQSHFDPVDPVHTNGSFHYKDQAVDVSGDPELMKKFAKRVAKRRKNKR